MDNNEKSIDFFKAKVKSIIAIANDKLYPKFSTFLDEHQQNIAYEILRAQKCYNYAFFGGYESATRVILGVYPDYLKAEDLEFPINFIKIAFPKSYKLTHREILGTLMSLQIKRETIGDIIIDETNAYVAVNEDISQYIEDNLFKISNVGVVVTKLNELDVQIENKFETVNINISSMRIDCIVSALTRLSRGKAVEVINASKVYINSQLVSSVSDILSPFDTITIRGYGKYTVTNEINMSKKGRYFVLVKKYA